MKSCKIFLIGCRDNRLLANGFHTCRPLNRKVAKSVLLISANFLFRIFPKLLDLLTTSAHTITQHIVNSQDQNMVAKNIIQQKYAKLITVNIRHVHKNIPKLANMEKIACSKQNVFIDTRTTQHKIFIIII